MSIDIRYRGYGVDDQGRTGVFETHSKEDILRYAKKAKNSTYIEVIEVKRIILKEQYDQLSLFDYNPD